MVLTAMVPLRTNEPYPMTRVIPPKVAPASTRSGVPETVSGRALLRLWTWAAVPASVTSVPADSVTSSLEVGSALLDQLFGLFQLTPSPPPCRQEPLQVLPRGDQ